MPMLERAREKSDGHLPRRPLRPDNRNDIDSPRP